MRCGASRTLTPVLSLEDDLPCKLHKAWIIHLVLAVDYSKATIRTWENCGLGKCVGWRDELYAIEGVENFYAKLESHPICGAEIRALECCDVPVVDA